MILALRRQRQVDLCEFKASLVYRVSSMTEPKLIMSPCLKKKKKKKNRNKSSNNNNHVDQLLLCP